MSIIAFEISINGEHKYTVGAENWMTVWANLVGNRLSPNVLLPGAEDSNQQLPTIGAVYIRFSAMVSVPADENANHESISKQGLSAQKTGNYESVRLDVGDVININVIESDDCDEPEWQPDELHGPTAIRFQTTQD